MTDTTRPSTGAEIPEGFQRVEETVRGVDSAPFVEILDQRFGIPPRLFDQLLVFRPNNRWLSIVDRRLLVPLSPAHAGVGMPFFYDRLVHPRPTTATAIRFGAHARSNGVDLDTLPRQGPEGDPDPVHRFVRRQKVVLDTQAWGGLTGPGYVLARHRGRVLGLGHCRIEEGLWVLTPQVPHGWARRLSSTGEEVVENELGEA